MDWKKTFNTGFWAIHTVFFIGIVATILSTVYALRLNQYQNTEKSIATKVDTLIKNFKTDDSFETIAKYLSRAQSDKAQETIHHLSRNIAETEDLLELKASPELSENIRTFNGLISHTSGMSNPSDALKVLNQKISSLIGVAKSQGYRSVLSISEGMEKRLSSLNSKNVGGSPQVSYLATDLKKLQKIVANSTLTDGEKATLDNRFQSMSEEIELLSTLNVQGRDLQKHVTKAGLALGEWVLVLEKRSQSLETIREAKQNKLIIILAAVVAFFTISWMGIAYLSRWQKSKIEGQVESEVKSIIEKGILGDERFMVDHFSEATRNDIIHLLDTLKVKLSLGSMLHNGLPFAGCLIDNNFKVTWHNHLFLEQFYLSEEEVKSEAFNWDYLRDYLNLEQDPVYEALVNKIAGIFPVKVKQDEFAPAQPYEMYVTPVFANREDRVMVFFYPLVSVKDAIQEQVSMATSTMGRFVELWNEEKLDEDELRLLEKDFKGNDLEETFDSLSQIYERVSSEKEECIRTIRSLERETSELSTTISEINGLEEDKKEIIKQEVHLANELKESFIHTLERSESLAQINKTIMQHNDELRTEASRIQQAYNEILKQKRESHEIISQLEQLKPDFKKLKYDLLEIKTRLISMSGQLFSPQASGDEAQQRVLARLKEEIFRLDSAVVALEKKISFSDVLQSKLLMMNEKLTAEQTSFSWQSTQKDHVLRETLSSIQKSLSDEERKIIESLQSLGELMKLDYSKSQEAALKSTTESLLS